MVNLSRQPTCASLLRGDSLAVDDTDVDREIARNLWRHHRMLPPGSRFKHYWDYYMVCLVLYNCILTPMQLGFSRGPVFVESSTIIVVLDIVLWFHFLADLIVNFRTSFYDEEHQIVLSAGTVAQRYFNGWFGVDLFATLPYFLIGFFATLGSSGSSQMLVIGVCKIPICLRLLRLSSKLDELSSVGYFRVVLQMLGFIMVAHWVACLWWFIGRAAYYDEVGDLYGQSWLRRVPEGSTELYPNVTQTPFSQQYISSLYWSLTTLMKTPWVGPDTVTEKIYASLMVVVGATLFAMLLGSVTAMINTYNKRHSELRDQLTTLHTFATFRRVPAGLQRKMFAYVDAYWNMTAGLDNSSILNSLPPRLRGAVLIAIHGSLLKDCAMLRNCSEACATTLLLKAKPQVVLQKEDLLVPGQLCTDLYILITGALQVTLPTADEAEAYATEGAPGTSCIVAEEMSVGGRGTAAERSTSGGGAANRENSRATRSTSSRPGGAASSHALKGERLRFRVVEKPGQLIGLSEPFQQPTTYPFRVLALKTSQLVFISRQDMADVLSVFHGSDADAVCQVLRSDFLICWETLKPRGNRNSINSDPLSKYTDAGIAAKQAREIADLREKLTAFDQRLDDCIGSLNAVQSQTALLPQMQQALKALVDAHGTTA